MFQYPMFKNYLDISEKEDGNMYVIDSLQGCAFTVPPDTYFFAVQLNGYRDPGTIPGYTAQECRLILRELRHAKLLRQSRVLEKHFGTVYYTLLYDNLNSRFKGISKIWNDLLLLSFLPMLFVGLFCYVKATPLFEGSLMGGFLFGLILGAALHEFSHAAAGISYGATVHEAGMMIQRFLPGFYVLLEENEIRGKMQRIQVFAAGVEMNLLLGGLFFLLASFMPFDAFFFMAGFQNIIIALLNLCFISGLDGSRIVGELLGSGTFVFKTKEILFNKNNRRKLMSKPSGIAILTAAVILGICQIAFPLLLMDNFLAIFEVFQ